MFTLIRGAEVYAPAELGVRDVLVAGRSIARIAARIEVPRSLGARVIAAEGKRLAPGLVDLHVHLLGGGGEAGPASRTPEIRLSAITRAGVTTVVGCLGTDDVSRRPESLLAKAMQLEEEGISTFIYSGSYQLPPATITGSLRKDLALIPKVVGVGEVAVSDHRSSQPSFEELCRLAAEARVGGMLGGKAGLVHLHLGAGSRGLEPVLRIVRETEIPIQQFLPTHLARTPALLEQAIEFGRLGGALDFTAAGEGAEAPLSTPAVLRAALAAGVPLERLSLSSDSNGSMPVFDERGRLLSLAVADISALTAEVRLLVKAGFPLADVLALVTENPARRVGIWGWKGSLAEGKDADLLLLNEDLQVDSVMAKGRLMIEGGRVLVRGTFEA